MIHFIKAAPKHQSTKEFKTLGHTTSFYAYLFVKVVFYAVFCVSCFLLYHKKMRGASFNIRKLSRIKLPPDALLPARAQQFRLLAGICSPYEFFRQIVDFFAVMRYNILYMAEQSFYQKRNIKNLERIEGLLEELPPFVEEYFLGIENQTSTLTRLNYAYDLRIFFDYLSKKRLHGKDVRSITLSDLEAVSATDIERFISYLSNYEFRGAHESCNERAKARKLSTIRAMFKYFFKKEKISVDNAAKVTMPKLHEKEIIRLEPNEIADLLNCADSGSGMSNHQRAFHDRTRVRDVAILTLFLGTGIRISELVGLNDEDIDFSSNSFKVTRKGGNQAILYFSQEVADALARYIAFKEEGPEIPEGEHALFLSLKKRRISIRAVENLVKKYSRIISPLKKISPHKLRSTYGTQLYRETKDIYVVADVLGHKDVNTTRKHYAAISEDARRDVAEKVHLREQDPPQDK